jgi:hypothetical protein
MGRHAVNTLMRCQVNIQRQNQPAQLALREFVAGGKRQNRALSSTCSPNFFGPPVSRQLPCSPPWTLTALVLLCRMPREIRMLLSAQNAAQSGSGARSLGTIIPPSVSALKARVHLIALAACPLRVFCFRCFPLDTAVSDNPWCPSALTTGPGSQMPPPFQTPGLGFPASIPQVDIRKFRK